MGAAAGMAWLVDGRYETISMAISSMIGDVSGMICDGASNSCAMKVSASDLSMETVNFSQPNIKSVSSGPEGFATVLMIPKEGEWWNSKVVDTAGRTVFEKSGMQIYKARWFLDNPYSYPAKHDFVQPAK